jgi:hypothetical protein
VTTPDETGMLRALVLDLSRLLRSTFRLMDDMELRRKEALIAALEARAERDVLALEHALLRQALLDAAPTSALLAAPRLQVVLEASALLDMAGAVDVWDRAIDSLNGVKDAEDGVRSRMRRLRQYRETRTHE